MKEYNSIKVAEFATTQGIYKNPAFAWWVWYTLRKRDKIISTVNEWVKQTAHKYGVDILWSAKEAYALYNKNGNTLWRYELDKEMYNLQVAFNILGDNWKPLPGWSKASGHLIFDVRTTIEQKSWWVKYGHKNPETENLT